MRKREIFLFILLLLLIAILAFYFLYKQNQDGPPRLYPASISLQGYMEKQDDQDLHQYKTTDESMFLIREKEFLREGLKSITLSEGVDFYHTVKDMTISDIINAIHPSVEGIVIIYFYPGDDVNSPGYFAYPSYPDATIIQNMNFTIPEGAVFEIYSKNRAKAYGLLRSTQASKVDDYYALLNGVEDGWGLFAANEENLTVSFEDILHRVDYFWINDAKVMKNDASGYNMNGNYVVWIKLLAEDLIVPRVGIDNVGKNHLYVKWNVPSNYVFSTYPSDIRYDIYIYKGVDCNHGKKYRRYVEVIGEELKNGVLLINGLESDTVYAFDARAFSGGVDTDENYTDFSKCIIFSTNNS